MDGCGNQVFCGRGDEGGIGAGTGIPAPRPAQAQETLSFSCWNPGFSQPEECSAATAPQELLCAHSRRFLGKLGNGSLGDPKELLDGSVLFHRFREIQMVPLEFQTELDHYQQCQQTFPWEAFPVFSQIFHPKSNFSGHLPLFWETQPLLFRAAVQHFKGVFCHSQFYWNQENLGNTDFFWQDEFGILKCVTELSEHSRVTQNPGSSGNSHPSCSGV